MTTIIIERKLLEEVVEMFDNAISTRYPHEILRDIRATIAAPATAPEPSWQDAPTCAGLWFCDEGDENPYRFTCHNVSIPLNPHLVGESERWYGPIPPDGDKP